MELCNIGFSSLLLIGCSSSRVLIDLAICNIFFFNWLKDDMNCAEAYVRFLCQWLLDNCLDDMKFMADKYDRSCIDRLKMVSSTPFVRTSYTEAVEILEEAVKKGKQFENKVEWGIDLASEHERFVNSHPFHFHST